MIPLVTARVGWGSGQGNVDTTERLLTHPGQYQGWCGVGKI